MNRSRKYITNGNESAVPPHIAIERIAEKPLIRSSPSM